MKIENFEVVETCLYWKEKETLVIGDLHLGYEDSLSRQGFVGLVFTQKEKNKEILTRIFERVDYKISRVIILGDVKHNFGNIIRQESEDFKELIDFLENNLKNLKEIIITKGNHDKILEPLTKKYDFIKLKDNFSEDHILFLHGDKESLQKSQIEIYDKNTKLIIFGHFHPCFVLREKQGVKSERYKCFLYGKSKKFKKKIIYVPSFFPLIEGSDIETETDIYEEGMNIIAVDEEGNLYKKS